MTLYSLKRLFVATAVAALAAVPAVAQDLNGFFPAKGQGDFALSYTDESYDEFWVGTHKMSVPDIGKVTTRSLSLWGRYGFTDRVAVIANVPYVDVDSNGLAGFSDSGLQDLTALVEVNALERDGASRHRLVAAVGGRTELSDYEANAPVSLGDGTTDVLLRLVYQFEHGSFYFSQEVGYDLRGGDAPDGTPLSTELGYTLRRVTITGFYYRYVAHGGTDIGDPGFTFPSNKDETERVGAKVFGRASNSFGLFAAWFTTLSGRNSGDASGVSVGTTYSF